MIDGPSPLPDEPESTPSITDGPEIEVRIKGSRFLGQAFRASGEGAVTRKIELVRQRHHAASHHCWASRLGPINAALERSDDDGEPSGTAGLPILGALQRANVYEAVVVVTRYFGGSKLGRGGLTRAYSDAARQALESAPRARIWHDAILQVGCSFDDLGAVEAILSREAESIRSVTREFSPEPEMLLQLRRGAALRIAEAIREKTGARARLLWRES
jgi:uncharacterized YigZ family protein